MRPRGVAKGNPVASKMMDSQKQAERKTTSTHRNTPSLQIPEEGFRGVPFYLPVKDTREVRGGRWVFVDDGRCGLFASFDHFPPLTTARKYRIARKIPRMSTANQAKARSKLKEPGVYNGATIGRGIPDDCSVKAR